jgi:hypothetical protein
MNIVTGDCPGVLIITQVRLRGQCSQFRELSASHENGQKNNSPTPEKRDRHSRHRHFTYSHTIHLHPDNSAASVSEVAYG